MEFTEFLNNIEKYTEEPSSTEENTYFHLHPTEDKENQPSVNTYQQSTSTVGIVKQYETNKPEDQYIELDATDEASLNNGMLTKVWGPPLWVGLHAITFGYPAEIDESNQEHITRRESYYRFFELIGDVLPCKYCRQSYKVFFTELNPRPFMSKRQDIVRWLYLIHEKVNDKLKVPDCNRITFRDFTAQYESYRAKCKPDNREEELVKQSNEEKGCVKPLDNTPKRAVINVVKCDKGDVTRRDNAFENMVNTDSQDNYMIIHKKWLVFLALTIFIGVLAYILINYTDCGCSA
jgi:hypothetical protein